MVTRMYPAATSAAQVSPTFDAGWVSTTGAVRRRLALTKASATETRATVTVTSGANNETLGFQCVSDPLDGAQTITGTVTIMTRGRELATTDNVDRRARGIRVVSGDGSTVRGTLLTQGFNASDTAELGTSVTGYRAANATSLSSVSAQDGDRIVVELGYGMSSTGTTPQFDMVVGGNGTDCANADGTSTGTVPWVEFSQDLTFKTVTAPTSITSADLAEGTGNRSFAAVSTQAGDFVVVGIQVENGQTATYTPSGTGVSFPGSAQADSGTPGGSNGRAMIWAGTDSSGGSRTIQITVGGSAASYRARVTVARDGTAVGATGANSATQTVTLGRQGDDSMMFYGVTDWSTGAVGTPVWTPGGSTTASQQGTNGTYIFGRWDDSGTAASEAHGISSPSFTTPAVAVLELLGTFVSGTTTVDGTAAGSIVVDGTAAGVPTVVGAAAGSVVVAGTAQGVPTVFGVSAGTVDVAGTAAGVKTVLGAAAGSLVVDGQASGSSTTPPVEGTAAGSIVVDGQASGVPIVLGTAAGSLVIDGAAAGVPVVPGVAAGAVVVAGTGQGVPTVLGQAAGALVVTGTATGEIAGVTTGTAAGAIVVAGTAQGVPTVVGAPAGAVTLAGAANGVRIVLGAAAGALTFAPVVAGVRVVSGAVAGTIAVVGTALGEVPLPFTVGALTPSTAPTAGLAPASARTGVLAASSSRAGPR